jgi:basic membrane protein A
MLMIIVTALIAFIGGQAFGSMYGFFAGYPVVRIEVDGKEVKGDVPGVLLSNRVMVPIRFVSEALGAEVGWDQNRLAVVISTAPVVLDPPEDPDPGPEPDPPTGTLRVGMLSASGDIRDDPFESNVWAGLQRSMDDFGVTASYMAPTISGPENLLEAIDKLIAAGSALIVAPGWYYGSAVYDAQIRPMSPYFVALDCYPHAGDWIPNLGARTVSIFFAEHEAGFLAGLAAALRISDGEAGFIGGMELPAVQRFNWGFQQGLAYANANYGTTVALQPENFVYQGTFGDVEAGEELAYAMYERGVDVIFAAAGQLGTGVIEAAKRQTMAGNRVWMVGVDHDQFAEGIYDDDGSSVVLTSAVKRLDQAAYDMVAALLQDKFPGSQTIDYTVREGGVGLPAHNPNLSSEVMAKVSEVIARIKDGKVSISPVRGSLLP